MKANLLDYLKSEKDEEGEDTAEEMKPEAGEGDLNDMKVKLLAMKYEQTHDPDKRVDALIALVRCIAGDKPAPSSEE